MKKFINKFQTIIILLAIFTITAALFFLNKIPYLSISRVVSLGDIFLFVTFLALVWYAWETGEMRKEMVRQTEVEQMPFMVPYIRNVEVDKIGEQKNYRLIDLQAKGYGYDYDKMKAHNLSRYYVFRIRNVGKGPALNVKVESDNFIATKYQANFFAPKRDEHSIQIMQKTDNLVDPFQFKELSDLEGVEFRISCNAASKQKYCFKYKIKKLKTEDKKEEIEIEYLGYDKIK